MTLNNMVDATLCGCQTYSVVFINRHVHPQPPICIDDIERSHPIERSNHEGKKQLLVKFKSYKTKSRVYKSKANLKKNSSNVFLSQDLTRMNYELVVNLLVTIRVTVNSGIYMYMVIMGTL